MTNERVSRLLPLQIQVEASQFTAEAPPTARPDGTITERPRRAGLASLLWNVKVSLARARLLKYRPGWM